MAGVTGSVVYKGQPVSGATVTFFPTATGHRSAGGVSDANGHFILMTYDKDDGAVLGKHRVAVAKRETVSAGKVPEGMGAAYLEELEAQAAEKGKALIPEKFFSPDSSGLEKVVEKGTNDFKLELVD